MEAVTKLVALRFTVIAVLFGSFTLDAHAQSPAVGRLNAVVGKAEITRGGQVVKASKGMDIFSTDLLVTSPRTAVKIQFSDGSSFMAFENSSVKIEEYKIQAGKGKDVSVKSAFDIAKGKVRFFVKPKEDGNTNEVAFKTANAVMGIRGTSGVIDVSQPGRTQLVVLTGKVEVSNPANPTARIFVAANQMTDVVGKQPPLAPRVVPPQLLKQMGRDADSADGTRKGGEAPAGESQEKKEKNNKGTDNKESGTNNDPNKPSGDDAKPAVGDDGNAPPSDEAKPAPTGKKDEVTPAKEEPKETTPPKENPAKKESSAEAAAAPQNSPKEEKPAVEAPKMEKKVVYNPDGKSSVVVTGNSNLQQAVAPPVMGGVRIQDSQPSALKTIQTQAQQVNSITSAIEQKVTSSFETQRQVTASTTPPPPVRRTIRVKVQLPTSAP